MSIANRLLFSLWVLLSLCLLCHCAAYHRMPASDKTVQAKLKPPDNATLRVRASEFKHPLIPPVELSPDEGLTPEGASVIAVLLNPSLRAIRDQRKLANVQLLDAKLLPNPDVSAGVEKVVGGKPGSVTGYGLGLDWDVTSLISRSAKISSAKSEKAAVELDIAWQEWQVAQAGRLAVYQLKSLQEQIAVVQSAVRSMDQYKGKYQAALTNGTIDYPTLTEFLAVYQQMNSHLQELEDQAATQRLQLIRLMGLPESTQISLSDKIVLPSKFELPDSTTLYDGLEQRRLDLMALRKGYDSQEAAVRQAIREQFPKISLGPTLNRDTDNIRTIGFGLNIELPVFNHSQGKVKAEQATRQILFDEYVNRVFEMHSDIAIIASGIHFLNQQIEAVRQADSTLSALYHKLQSALADGRTDAFTYYKVWNDLVETQSNLYDLEGQLAQARIALQLETGYYDIPSREHKSTTMPSPGTTGGTP